MTLSWYQANAIRWALVATLLSTQLVTIKWLLLSCDTYTVVSCGKNTIKQAVKVIWRMFPRFQRVSTPNRISIRSAVFSQRNRVPDRQTNWLTTYGLTTRPRYGNIDRNSPHAVDAAYRCTASRTHRPPRTVTSCSKSFQRHLWASRLLAGTEI